MELVEGPTLAERIKQGAVPLEEALAIAKQIADALEAAQEGALSKRREGGTFETSYLLSRKSVDFIAQGA